MKYVYIFLAAVLLILGFRTLWVSGISSLPSQFISYPSQITVKDVIGATNQERSKLALPPLSQNEQLSAAAAKKAEHMLANNYWSHIGSDGKTPWAFIKEQNYQYKTAGENLAKHFQNTNELLRAWMASPTHKANIINEKYNDIGVAVVTGRVQGVETTLVVQMFGLAQNDLPRASTLDWQDRLTVEEMSDQAINTVNVSPLLTPVQISKLIVLITIISIIIFGGYYYYDHYLVAKIHWHHLLAYQIMPQLFFAVAIAVIVIYFKAGVIK